MVDCVCSIGGNVKEHDRGVQIVRARRTAADDERADRMITMDELEQVYPRQMW